MFSISQRTFSSALFIIFTFFLMPSLIYSESINIGRTRPGEYKTDEVGDFNKLLLKKFPTQDDYHNRYAHLKKSSTASPSETTSSTKDNDNNSSSILPESEMNSSDSSNSNSGSSGNSCSGCKNREGIKYINKQELRDEILRKMGFTLAPNITGRLLPRIPEHYLQQIEDNELMQSDQAVAGQGEDGDDGDDGFDDTYNMKTERILTFAKRYPHLRHSWNSDNILYFAFSKIVTKFHVNTSTLNFFIHGSGDHPYGIVSIEIYKIHKLGEHNEPILLRVHSSKEIQPSGIGRWFKFDLTETVSEWFKNGEENYGFIINATCHGKNVGATNVEKINSEIPYLETTVKEVKRRVRRNIGLNCDINDHQPLCCRYNFIIDFVDIGLDFIIAPKRFNAGMCDGECPLLTLQKYPHTHLLKMTSPNSAGPCCSPRKMSSMSILYFDDKYSVVYSTFPGMVVDRCGCS